MYGVSNGIDLHSRFDLVGEFKVFKFCLPGREQAKAYQGQKFAKLGFIYIASVSRSLSSVVP